MHKNQNNRLQKTILSDSRKKRTVVGDSSIETDDFDIGVADTYKK